VVTLEDLANSLPVWTTDSLGRHLHRDDLLDELAATASADALTGLVADVNNDKRKTFTKRAVLDLIAEWT
jgi:hypothetical protein